jgi:hypothetical protein
MRPTNLEAAFGDIVRNTLRLMQWRSWTIEQSGRPFFLEPRKPLVADPTAAKDSSCSRTATTKRIRSSTAQVSIHPIGKVLLADQLTCYLCRRSIVLPM